MASLITHPVVPLSLGIAMGRSNIPLKAVLLGVLLSMLPDADVIAFRFGIPYEHALGHRGVTHSLAFAAILALCLCSLPAFSARRGRVFLFLLISAASHGILDALTNGGLGVGFFIPANDHRYFLPWRPIKVSPLSVQAFFSARGWIILKSELTAVWLPCLAGALAIFWIRRAKARA